MSTPAALESVAPVASKALTLTTGRGRPNGAEDVEAGPLHFRIGAVELCLRSEVEGVLSDYRALYRDFQEQTLLPEALDVRVCRERSRYTLGKRFVIRGGGERLFSVKRTEEILPYLECGINWQVSKRLPRYLQVHAAVVQYGGSGVMLPGQPRSGKSTLTAALMTRGWRYLSDEFALIDPETKLLHPFPRALCIKEGSFEVIERLGLPLSACKRYSKGKKGWVVYLSPAQFGDDVLGRPCPVRYVVFPQYQAGARPKLTPISRGEAVFLLNQQSFNFDRFGAAGLRLLSDALRAAGCYQLMAGEAERTCDLMTRLAEDGDQA